ncbi:MAG TPA: acetoin utilization protein AcuC [Frankiaceae bacterium]|nr:acetoin utilization protein AcuC [Frankiaceae bacterium]
MSTSTLVMWADDFMSYDLGPAHPLHPVRLELTIDLCRRLGVLDRPGVTLRGAGFAPDELLELVHDPDYLQAVRDAPERWAGQSWTGHLADRYGLGTPDNPIFHRMHEAAAQITGATVAAAEAVWTGTHQHAVNIAGGLHHAMRTRASGFCIYNDPAVAMRWLLGQGARRIAYVDVDVHHGDGVEAAFYDDPRVLTISLHQSGTTLFPGTGFPEDYGRGEAEGTAVNVALPPFTGDGAWLRAFSGIVPVLVRAFRPEVLVTQHGCDSHRLDPLADLVLSVDGQRESYAALHALAHEVCGGRWVACGGGGYALAAVVPRAWTTLIGVATGAPPDPATPLPEQWRELARQRTRCLAGPVDPPPGTLGDGTNPTYLPWDAGDGDPDSQVDRSIARTRHEVLPLHGLDPLVDR